MSDFRKSFLRESGGLPGQTQGPRVTLGALGKHPGWDDHIEGLLDTETLALFKNIFYIQCIGRGIDSGGWDKPESAADIIAFDHYLAWVRGDQFLLGRLWASSDGRGRTKYPMILCAQCGGLPFDWALQNILPKLDQIQEACRNVRTAAEVRQIIQKAQADLRQMAAGAPSLAGAGVSLDRAAFLAGPELGPEQTGLMRILHEFEANFIAFKKAKPGKTAGGDPRAQHIRVPRNAASPAASLLAWREFFNLLFPKDLAVLLVAPAGKPWVDIFAGEPTANEIFPLRAQSVGVASSVPYTIGPDIRAECAELTRQFESGEAPATGQTLFIKKTETKPSPPPPPSSPSAGWEAPPNAKGMNLKWIGLGGGGLVVLVLVCALWFGHGKPPPPNASEETKPAPTQAAPPQQPPKELPKEPPKPKEPPPFVVVTPPPAAAKTNAEHLPAKEPSWTPPILVRDGSSREVVRVGAKIAPVSFHVSDARTPAEKLGWSFSSSNPALLPVEGIHLGRDGAAWQVSLAPTPDQTGTASVTVTVTNEGGLVATNQFALEVEAVPPPPRFDQLLGDVQIKRGQPFQGVVKVSDGKIPAASLQLKARVEPFGWVAASVSGDGAERTVRLDARDAAPGVGRLVLELSNGESKATNVSSIELVLPEPPEFVVFPQGSNSIPAGKTSPPLEFVVSNKSGPADQIHFSVTSRNQKAIANDNVKFNQDGSAWHVTITPNAGAPAGRVGLEAVATDALGLSATNLFAVNVALPEGIMRNALGMEFVWVKGLPGEEQAAWDSTHAHGGWVAKYLITQKDFSSVMRNNPSAYKGGDLYPVESMTAAEAEDFCRKLPAQDQSGQTFPTGWSYQVLTLDQWRFCAEGVVDADCVLSGPTLKRQHPEAVGTLATNALGLCDVIGNVYELTPASAGAEWMSGASFDQQHVLRAIFPFNPGSQTGFRIAITHASPTP